MKVLIIADVLGSENNGTTIACMNLIRYLKSQGDEVNVVCCDQDKINKEGYYVVPSYNLGKFLNNYIKKNGVSIAKPDKNILTKAIKETDICHAMVPFPLARKALKIAKKYGKPMTAGFHCQAENFTSHIFCKNVGFVNHLTYKNFYKHFYKHVDAIHYPTEFIKNVFENETNCTTKAYVISNGVNKCFVKKEIQKPDYLKDKFTILFIGRYSKEKSHDILIKAVNESKYKDKIQLIFAGSGPRRKHINKLVDALNISKPIMEFFSREKLIEVINHSDLYCHPAEIEIEAISCLEAISCGLVPVISNSKRCATKNFAIDEKNLFECNNYFDLAKKIDYWIENKEEKERYSNKYLESRGQFDYEECMKKMRNMLIDTLKENK